MKPEHRDIIDRAKLHGLYPSTIAHELLVRDLVDTVITELRHQRLPFHLLKEEEQQEVIERATERAKEAAGVAIQIISARGAASVQVDMKAIKVEAKTMTITAKVDGAEPNKHELTDAAGKLCLLVIAPNDYEEALDDISPDRDQREIPLNAGAIAESLVGTGISDPLYREAVAFVVKTRRASISGIQRVLTIGYNRAARIVEAMEGSGIVSAPNSNGEREVIAVDVPKVNADHAPSSNDPSQDNQAAPNEEPDTDPLAGAGESRTQTYAGHTLGEIALAVATKKDVFDIGWLQARFALTTDEAQSVTLQLLDGGVIALEAEGENSETHTYRMLKQPTEIDLNLE